MGPLLGRAARPPVGVLVSIEVDASTVRRGDQIMVGGQALLVLDMMSLARGGKRLHFASGESLTMSSTTVLWAARRINPRLARRR
ncbi:hypothetical protein [Streptomyces litchfieldiae]|uniref:Uncharacterized protein n=1 Tax=Streptomyces litchfieldiae TaxID=3075543 RepID=A0ABU2MLN8_9ACTN|nr:hypothetical protein [Streptomyces sp. DSM 44938]MDT0342342.1 hypothetical protein [Streptomyces sp. DSM 44938]